MAAKINRLVDYVVIVGYDFEANQRNAKGKILQRFPEKDWPDTNFIEGIEFFCQPLGWQLITTSKQAQKYAPKFFQFVLTDIDVDRHYCACLTFYETVKQSKLAATAAQSSQSQSEQHHNHHEQQQYTHQAAIHQDTLYAPKCIVLISRLDCREVFRNCLSILYAVHVDNLMYSLETIIGNLLSAVKVPSFGGPSVTFSLSAGDCLVLQPPQSDTIPVTSTTVFRLLEHLGINNVIELFYALLTEHKILFHSQSYTRLNEACQGLISLMYPFKYSHTYIPVLPATLIEFLSTPTPFIIGVHSSLKREISDLLDVIVVDIDGGSVKVPDSLHIPRLEEPFNSELMSLLVHITKPHIIHADDAFSNPSSAQPSSPDIMDKEIRAIFLRSITQILQGYRSCLTVMRIHPKTLISFHKASYLGQRGFVDNEFMTRLLESMFFEKFVESRGLPYRQCDLFDELHATLHERLQEERRDIDAILRHIKNLAHSLKENESPSRRPPILKAIKPSDDKANSLVQKAFPTLDRVKIAEVIEKQSRRGSVVSESLSIPHATETSLQPRPQNGNEALESSIGNTDQSSLRHVPIGLSAEQVKSEFNANEFVINSARRLEVMRNCVDCVFENKISDARKALPAVLKALKNKANRLALIEELACHLGSQRAVLEHQQFDLVVRLMNCALQHESHIDLNGVAAKILPLAMEFCRRLCTGIIQFAYTCIQDHPVWSNQQFWESSFYLDVEKDMIKLYGSSDSGLEVASKQLQHLNKLSIDHHNKLIDKWSKDEESTVYSQAVHYANRIVCMKVPLDISARTPKAATTNNIDALAFLGGNSSQRTHSNESDRNSNSDDESGFEDGSNNFSNPEIASAVIKFVSRFVDKVCIDSCVGEEHIKALHTMIPQVVAMQIEILEPVYKESKRLPPVMKPKITDPDLLEGEELLMNGLRTYLLPDGRDKDNVKDETIGANIGGPTLLPAEGAIFITNYRVIFKGRPCDPFYCEQTVVRSFPVATLTKEKRISVHAVPAVDQYLQEGLQLRSNTFQLIRVAFDEEVTSESIECFRKHVSRQKSPGSIHHLFAFTSQLVTPNKSIILTQKTKSQKSSTLKDFKRTLMKGAQKAGLKKKDCGNRIPGVVWTHSTTKAILMRSSGIQSKTMLETFRKSAKILYVMTEKSLIKSLKPELHKNCEFAPLDLHEARQVKNNFIKFLRICVPSGPLPPRESLAKTIETTEWLCQLKAVLECVNTVVDHIDKQGRSVLLAIEDAWDLSPQITSIAQICLDPYFRTFEGFRVLIEKEWLTFSHKSSSKSNHLAAAGPPSGFAPMFLQFLDLVHQIHGQFPLAFEFNQYYLKFMAYHQASCRFRTFLLESESEKSEAESLDHESLPPSPQSTGASFWEYAERLWNQSPIFFNYYYTPVNFIDPSKNMVLRPCASSTTLRLWDYYTSEDLIHGPSYDIEVFNMNRQHQEELQASADQSKVSRRRLMVTNYDNVHLAQPDGLTQAMSDLRSLEIEFRESPIPWSTLWSRIETSLPAVS